jgi:aminoglycoside 6'-N-acetyltransferase
MPAVSLRPATERDYGLILSWLRQAEIQRWWGSLAAAQAEVRAALLAPMGLCSIILVDGEPVGYAQAQEMPPFNPPIPGADTAGTFRVDLFIGDVRFRRQGVAQTALQLVTQDVFATTLMLGCIAVVPLKHEAAVRTYERAGFSWARVIDDPLLGPCWLMRCDRERPPC